MIISAIVATAQNSVIGKNNRIPWYLPADLKYFKKTTLHHHVIMGRSTFESIGKPLPKRTNIVLSRNPFFVASNVLIANSIEQAIQIARENDETEAFIIGGGRIYEQSVSFWDRIYWTKVDLEVEGDVFFPTIETEAWQLIKEAPQKADNKNEHDYSFQVWERK